MLSRIYERYLLGRIVDRAMGARRLVPCRRDCVEGTCGRVLEIGFGTGRNLPFYPDGVRCLVAVEPSSFARRLARKRITKRALDVRFADVHDGKLPFADASFDSAVSTWTLCTIADASQALREVSRVLRPGARFYFVEHGLAPAGDQRVRAWQYRLDPLQQALGGGCHLVRDIERLIGESGFKILRLEKSYIPGPRPWCYFYRGVAEIE